MKNRGTSTTLYPVSSFVRICTGDSFIPDNGQTKLIYLGRSTFDFNSRYLNENFDKITGGPVSSIGKGDVLDAHGNHAL
jgi:hypothetical protein